MAVRKKAPVKKTSGTASKKKPRKGKSARVPFTVVIWIFIIIVLVSLLFILLPKAVKGNQTIAEQPGIPETPPKEAPLPPPVVKPDPPKPPPAAVPVAEKPVSQKPSPQKPETPAPTVITPPKTPVTAPLKKPPATTPIQPPSAVQPPAPLPVTSPVAPPVAPPVVQPVEMRDRSIYFMQDRGGGSELIITKVNRRLRVTDSPLLDCISVLLAGPSSDERGRNLVSFIPDGSRIISAQIRGNTAYLDFNEEFRYNTFGREGGIAQLQQIVWTATEFPNVNNVQILIEGKQVDFLNEGILIGSPLVR